MTIATRSEPKPPVGVIESLTTGFELVASHIGLVFIPIALDIFLWLGPHLSIAPITQSLIDFFNNLQTPDEASAESFENLTRSFQLIGESTNVFRFLSTAPLGVPSLMGSQAPDRVPGGSPLVLGIDNALIFITLVLGLSLIGLLLGAIYFVLIGALFADDDSLTWRDLLSRVLVNWARVTALGLLFVLLLGGLAFLFAVFVGIAQGFLVLLGSLVPGAQSLGVVTAALTQIVMGVIVMWLLLFLAFSLHGMVLRNRGVFGSMWDSIRLVQWNLLSVLGLFILIYLINMGLSYLWSLPARDSWLTLAGIGGHAFISTSLVAATFAFYKDRYRWWTEMREWLLTQKKRTLGR